MARNGDFIVFGGCCDVDVGSSMVVDGEDCLSFSSVLFWINHVIENASQYHVYKFLSRAQEAVNDNKRPKDDREEDWEEPNAEPIEPLYHLLKKKKIEEPSKFVSFQRQCTPLLECPICESVFVDPVGLECGHAFCRYCFYKKLDKDLGKDLVLSLIHI